MNELKLAIGRKGPSQGYITILGNSSQGDYAAFQPGQGNSMGGAPTLPTCSAAAT